MSENYSRPLVSVIVPAYNAASYLRETLESAIAQSYDNLEILVIDDGSTDETAQIASTFGDPVRVISTRNQGVAKARNTGIDASSGEFIALLDSDDLWKPDKIAIQLDAVDASHRLIYTDAITFGTANLPEMLMSANEELPSGDIRARLIERNFIPTSSVLLDRKVAVQVGGFNADIPVCDDWDFWLRALSFTGAKFINRPLVRYRVHENSLGSNTEKRISGSLKVIDAGLLALDLDAKEKRSIRGIAVSECYGYAATLARSESRHSLAMKLFLKAYLCHPSWSLIKEIVKTLIGPKLLQQIRPGTTI